jgi:hypothetical protein
MDDTTSRALPTDPVELRTLRDRLARKLRDHPNSSPGVHALAIELQSIDDPKDLEAVFTYLKLGM